MKQGRQSMILEVISRFDVETQEELSELLKEKGFEVTQATISRDIKELKLLKVQSDNGKYKYAVSGGSQTGRLDVLKRMFRDTVISLTKAASLVIVRTIPGGAAAASEAIDELRLPEIAGTLAGENTVFIAVREEGMQKIVIDELGRITNSKSEV